MNFSSTFVRSPLPVEPCFVLGTDPFSPSAGRGPAPGNLDVVLAMAPAPSPFPGGPHEAPAPTSSLWGLCGSLPFSSLRRRGWSQPQLLGLPLEAPKSTQSNPPAPCYQAGWGPLLKKKNPTVQVLLEGTAPAGDAPRKGKAQSSLSSAVAPGRCHASVLPSASLAPRAPGFPSPSPGDARGQDLGQFAGILLLFASFKSLQTDPVSWL